MENTIVIGYQKIFCTLTNLTLDQLPNTKLDIHLFYLPTKTLVLIIISSYIHYQDKNIVQSRELVKISTNDENVSCQVLVSIYNSLFSFIFYLFIQKSACLSVYQPLYLFEMNYMLIADMCCKNKNSFINRHIIYSYPL